MTGFQFLQILSDCKYRTVGKQQRNNFQAWSFVTTLWRSLIKFTRWTVNYCTLSCRLLKLELVLVWHHLDNIIYKSFQILKLYNAIRKKEKKKKHHYPCLLNYAISDKGFSKPASSVFGIILFIVVSYCINPFNIVPFFTFVDLTAYILYHSLLL